MCVCARACTRAGAGSAVSNSFQPYRLLYLPGSSVHGIFLARILECVAISSSRGSSRPRDQTHISYIHLDSRWILLPLSHHRGCQQEIKKGEGKKNVLLNLQTNAPDLRGKQTIKILRGNTGKQTVQMQEGRKLDLEKQ